jgi:Periplasmic binding protein-like domain
LVVHSDPHAIAVAQFCTELGSAIPGDLAIVSYDDEIAHLARPPRTDTGATFTYVCSWMSRFESWHRGPRSVTKVLPRPMP